MGLPSEADSTLYPFRELLMLESCGSVASQVRSAPVNVRTHRSRRPAPPCTRCECTPGCTYRATSLTWPAPAAVVRR